jgi:hypothetical protein
VVSDPRLDAGVGRAAHDHAADREERQARSDSRTINVAALIDELSQLAPGQPAAIDLEVVENDTGNTTD